MSLVSSSNMNTEDAEHRNIININMKKKRTKGASLRDT